MALAGRPGHDAAYDLLERAYRQSVGGPLPPVLQAEGGKPYFLRGRMQFSLSHTRTAAFCVLSRQPVGIDAETVRPVQRRVALRTMNEPELRWLDAQPDADVGFLTLWTAKEAWSKLTGRGLRWQPRAIELTCDPLGVPGEAARFITRTVGDVIVTVCTRTAEPAEWRWLNAAGSFESLP